MPIIEITQLDGEVISNNYSSPKEIEFLIPKEASSVVCTYYASSSSIEEPNENSNMVVRVDNGVLYVENLTAKATISLFDANGKKLQSIQTEQASVTSPIQHVGLLMVEITSGNQHIVRKVMAD